MMDKNAMKEVRKIFFPRVAKHLKGNKQNNL